MSKIGSFSVCQGGRGACKHGSWERDGGKATPNLRVTANAPSMSPFSLIAAGDVHVNAKPKKDVLFARLP